MVEQLMFLSLALLGISISIPKPRLCAPLWLSGAEVGMEMKDAKEVTRVTRDAKSTLESTVTKYLLTVDFLGQAWTCSGIAWDV